MRRTAPRHLAAIGALLLTAIAVASYAFPSDDYLYVPNEARPLREHVSIAGRPEADDAGGIFFVDVTVRRARWAEAIAPFLRPDGATLVSGANLDAHGGSKERQERARVEMELSERVAAAVALREAGHEVETKERGARIDAVADGVPAAKALAPGDVILSVGGRPTLSPEALQAAVRSGRPGESLRVRFRRGAKVLERTVRTVGAPDDPQRPMIGIQVSADLEITLPLDVRIDLGRVGGPSAGLAFALEVLQELGRDVDRGHRIAATGEIDLDGSVNPVGGLEQKTIGARRAGVEVFIVPAGDNAAVARRFAGTMRVVPVESYQQALSALASLPEM